MRLLIADDHALVRGGLRALLADFPEVTDVREAADGQEAVAAVSEQRPDVVLMDICMPHLNGLEATARILGIAPDTRVVIVSMHQEEQHVWDALHAGAAGYICKSAIADELRQALRAVAQGEVFVSRKLQRAMGREPQLRPSPRQLEVLRLIAAGKTSREIAAALHIHVKTVESHRMHLMRRLDIHEVAGLVRYAVRNGFVQTQ